tara:strand:+ start:1317 stop:1475 length:159 start_codon:yes stop_codon:yes gene_type:complete
MKTIKALDENELEEEEEEAKRVKRSELNARVQERRKCFHRLRPDEVLERMGY